jgi:hypothetical protein
MPPPSVTIVRKRGAGITDAGTDFRMAIIGTSSLAPWGTGVLSPLYGSGDALAADAGIGDGIDAAYHALQVQDDNPSPPALAFLSTLGLSGTTLGARGTLTQTGVTGGATVVETASTHPLGTIEPKVRVADDGNGGAGTPIGTAGIVLQGSVDNGRTWLPTSALGTATTWKLQIPNPGGSPYDTGVQYDFALAVTGSADVTAGSLYDNSGSGLDGLTLILTVNGTNHTLTFLYSGNALNQAAMIAAIHSQWSTITATVVSTHLVLTDSSPGGTIVVGAGTANAALGLTAGTTIGQLKTGDTWSESKTTPPQFAVADLYTAGSPGTGALMTIAQAAFNVGLVVIAEPVAAADIATLSAGLTAMANLRASCRPTLIVRFRNQAAGESDATYVAAFQAFRAACADDERIAIWANDGWLTDAQRQYVYSRSGLPSFLAKLQGMSVLSGPKGERIAQSPGMTSRGPLVGFTIHDTAGNPVGHDERVHPGILGPLAGKGGGVCCYYEASDTVSGTYVCVQADTLCPVLPATSGVQSLMDNRVSSACERALYTVSFLALGGADVVTNFTLDDDTREAMAAAGMKAIKDAGLTNEFANAEDPNLLTVDALVTVSGTLTSVTWRFNDNLYRYTNSITITIQNARA